MRPRGGQRSRPGPDRRQGRGWRAAHRPTMRCAVSIRRTSSGVGRIGRCGQPRASTATRVFFAANQHINPTNVCMLRKTCVFCSFARMPKEEGAYTRTHGGGVCRGGSRARQSHARVPHRRWPDMPSSALEYYTEMFRASRRGTPRCTSRRSPRSRSRTSPNREDTTSVEVLTR